jgi:GNAT superfamily N-acetyltransferase
MTAEIRPAEVADAYDIARVHVESWRETYRGMVPDEMLAALSVQKRTDAWGQIMAGPSKDGGITCVFLAVIDGVIVGFGSCGAQRTDTLRDRGYDGEVGAIYILQSVQGRGLGKRLMNSMVKNLRGRGFHGAALWVLRENARARRFYESGGGVKIGDRCEDRGGGVTFYEVAYGWPNLAAFVWEPSEGDSHVVEAG